MEKHVELKKIEDFWSWFKVNNDKYLFLNQIDSEEVKENLLDEFNIQLHNYCENLFFEIGGHPDNQIQELIITAEGNKEYFEKVENLIDFAPKIKDWQIVAFKPPMEKGFIINIEAKEFDPSKIIYIPLNNKDNPSAIGIHVCYPDYSDKERNVFATGTYLILDTLLGEKSSTLDIDYMDIIKTPENIVDYDFRHLEDIKEYINEKKNES
jgi:hypothetical protein